MLEADYHERIGELVAEAIQDGHYVSIYPESTKVRVNIVTSWGVYKGEAEVLWVSKTGKLEAIVEALGKVLERL